MDRYRRVEKPRPETPMSENEIRITTQGLIRNYVGYATSLIQDKKAKQIVLKAMGQAISKTVAIAEILKKNIHGLHQDTVISSISITDVWEPIEEGLIPLETVRYVSMISLSLSMKELNKNSPGYQAPASIEHHKVQRQQHQQVRQTMVRFPEASYGHEHGRGRGRNSGGRVGYVGYRGGYVGGYGGGYDDGYGGGYSTMQENGGMNYWRDDGGRGRNGGFRGAGFERGRGGRGFGGGGRGFGGGGRGFGGGRGVGWGYEGYGAGQGYRGFGAGHGYEIGGQGYGGRGGRLGYGGVHGYEGGGGGGQWGYEGRGSGRGYYRGGRMGVRGGRGNPQQVY